MDFATIIGIIGAFVIVIAAMVLGGSPMMFVNLPSLLIVVGGALFAVLMKFELGQFLSAGKIAVKAFSFKIQQPEDLISEVVDMAAEARKGGLLSLEGKETENKFLANGIQVLVDGHDPEVVRTLLTKDMNLAIERHDTGATIFSQLGEVAPAMGMIGTLVGLVAMLANMDDPKSIGPSMAVALLTTLYGAMVANMFAQPVADKLNLRAGQEAMSKRMVIDALLAIQAGQNPKVIESMLRTYLAEGKRPAEI